MRAELFKMTQAWVACQEKSGSSSAVLEKKSASGPHLDLHSRHYNGQHQIPAVSFLPRKYNGGGLDT